MGDEEQELEEGELEGMSRRSFKHVLITHSHPLDASRHIFMSRRLDDCQCKYSLCSFLEEARQLCHSLRVRFFQFFHTMGSFHSSFALLGILRCFT